MMKERLEGIMGIMLGNTSDGSSRVSATETRVTAQGFRLVNPKLSISHHAVNNVFLFPSTVMGFRELRE